MSTAADRLVFAVLGLLVGLVIVGGTGLLLLSKSEVVCPPIIQEAGGMQLYFGEGADNELTDLDHEFAEACGMEWDKAIPTDPIDSEPVSPQPKNGDA